MIQLNPLPPVSARDLALVTARVASDVWEGLRGKRLFIAGGTGFVGCWLLEALICANWRLGLGLSITVLTRDPTAFLRKAPHLAEDAAVILLQGDVRMLGSVNGQFDLLIHAATDVADANQSQLCAFDAIVRGSEQTLAMAARTGVQRCLYVSSGAVYGRVTTDLSHIPESYGGAPSVEDGSAYGHGKRASEWLVRSACKEAGIELVTARLFALIGPYLPLRGHFAASQFLRDALAGYPPTIKGGEHTVRSYLYGADMAVWLLTILIAGEAFQTYNVGSEEAVTIGTLARRVACLCLGNGEVRVQNPRIAGGLAGDRYVPDTEKARTLLALSEYTPLEQALAATIDWFRTSHHS